MSDVPDAEIAVEPVYVCSGCSGDFTLDELSIRRGCYVCLVCRAALERVARRKYVALAVALAVAVAISAVVFIEVRGDPGEGVATSVEELRSVDEAAREPVRQPVAAKPPTREAVVHTKSPWEAPDAAGQDGDRATSADAVSSRASELTEDSYETPRSRTDAERASATPHARVLRHGRYRETDPSSVRVRPMEGTSASVVLSGGRHEHIESTTVIPCRTGESWGFEFEVEGMQPSTTYAYRSEMRHPPIRQPDGTLLATSVVSDTLTPTGDRLSLAEIWTFLEGAEYELVPGVWTRTIFVDEHAICSQSFTLVTAVTASERAVTDDALGTGGGGDSLITAADSAGLWRLTSDIELDLTRSDDLALALSSGAESLRSDALAPGAGQASLLLVRFAGDTDLLAPTLGRGMHLLTPFRLLPFTGGERTEFANAVLPARRELLVALDGSTETLVFDATRFGAGAYVPEDEERSAVQGVFTLDDLTYLVVDRGGNEFHLDGSGRLDRVHLLGQQPVEYVYALREFPGETMLPGMQLRVVGGDRKTVTGAGLRLPARLELIDVDGVKIDDFAFDDVSNGVQYLPVDVAASRHARIAVMTDRSFRLVDRIGNELAFGLDGRCTGSKRLVFESARQGDREARFDLAFHDGSPRIERARVFRDGDAVAHWTVGYHYDIDGRLIRVTRSDGSEALVR